MPDDRAHSEFQHEGLVELTRVQPFEAEVIAARLRASGIEVVVGPGSPYGSVGFADGVPILVPEEDVPHAKTLVEATE